MVDGREEVGEVGGWGVGVGGVGGTDESGRLDECRLQEIGDLVEMSRRGGAGAGGGG